MGFYDGPPDPDNVCGTVLTAMLISFIVLTILVIISSMI